MTTANCFYLAESAVVTFDCRIIIGKRIDATKLVSERVLMHFYFILIDSMHSRLAAGTTGPCPIGHLFTIADSATKSAHATCQCKEGYVHWSDGQCYRTYTRGPCAVDEFLVNATTCIKNPCRKGYLFYPEHTQCYRIGEQGPCDLNQVIVFDFTARPSIDGISHNGVCGCKGIITNLDQKCSPDDIVSSPCQSVPGMVEINRQCYKLYTRGPCGPGFWLEPRKIIKRNDRRGAHCACRPNYTQYESEDGIVGCYAPNVGIARYLNGKHYRISVSGNEFVSSLKPSAFDELEQPKSTLGAVVAWAQMYLYLSSILLFEFSFLPIKYLSTDSVYHRRIQEHYRALINSSCLAYSRLFDGRHYLAPLSRFHLA